VGAHGHPIGELITVGEERGAVSGSVKHVELVCELMVNHVMPLLRMARPTQDSVPHQDHWTTGEGLAQNRDGGRYWTIYALEYTGAVLWRHYGGRVDEDRLHVAIVVMGQAQLQQTSLCRNGDANLCR